MQSDDRVRLQHMLDASQEARAFSHGHSRNNLHSDRMLLLALVKCIEIIGEAASKASEDVCAGAPDVPWPNIVAMRNRLIHGYFDINPDIVWRTVDEEIPQLIGPLQRLLEEWCHERHQPLLIRSPAQHGQPGQHEPGRWG
jgi:uncharacterized protein with HEPN domain